MTTRPILCNFESSSVNGRIMLYVFWHCLYAHAVRSSQILHRVRHQDDARMTRRARCSLSSAKVHSNMGEPTKSNMCNECMDISAFCKSLATEIVLQYYSKLSHEKVNHQHLALELALKPTRMALFANFLKTGTAE